ncbi:hypothetical protein [Lignipirellula cremea]|uniref:Protein-PII uridylyltransferase N-terminal domain-containing protein n=1 Tax=Lignipirellula cremea TaxID=2528010 RepID=A0A518DTY0_9BACT|nr:hypothetical protein [Lignipirellula cremea]QDU95287.1 hypothetical protein Pla8534_31020 [Lignipirellula cremea]
MTSDLADWRQLPAIARGRAWSLQVLQTFRQALEHECADSAVVAVAASGSLGRWEARPGSDCDTIVLVQNDASVSDREQAMACVNRAVGSTPLIASKPQGVFATPVSLAELVVPAARGQIDESLPLYGKRIQLLLDSQPAVGDAAYGATLDAILEWWSHGFVQEESGKRWTALLNDVVRYWRSYCVSRQWDFSPAGGGWLPRDIKLRHSRLLMCAAMLALLGKTGQLPRGQRGWLLDRLADPPLERLARMYEAFDEREQFFTLATCYDRFLAALENETLQTEWAAALPQGPGDLGQAPASYRQMKENADRFKEEIARFFLARHQVWPRFIERLLL